MTADYELSQVCIYSRYGWIIFWAISGFGCEERTVISSA